MKKLFVIDLMPFLYRGHFVFLRNPRMTAGGINTSALLGLANGLMGILRVEKPTHAVLAMDPGGPTFRHEAYPPYKAQRQKMPDDLAASIPYAFELAEALRIPVVRAEGFEADDVMGTIAVKGAAAGFDVYLATPDKDAAQLVRPGVRLYRPSHAGDAAEVYDEAAVCEHWHLREPSQMIDYLALAGDASDNIPGIRGVGEKTAADLLAKYGDVEGILANQPKMKGKLAEKIFAGREDARMSKFLTTIRTDVPIEPDWDAYLLDGVDRDKLAAVCAKFELNRLARELLGDDGQGAAGPAAQLKSIADTPHEYTYVTTEAQAQEVLALLMKAPRVAFDTETAARGPGMTARDASTCRLLGFSLAAEKGRAWYVDGGLVDVFRPLFADPTKTLIGHNVKFDRTVLHRYGVGFAYQPYNCHASLHSSEDPQPANTYRVFDAVAELVAGHQFSPAEVGHAVLSTAGAFLRPDRPAELCDVAVKDLVRGRTETLRQQDFHRLMSVTPQAVQAAAQMIFDPASCEFNDCAAGPASAAISGFAPISLRW